MKPVSYQVISSSVNGVQPDFGLNSLSGASKTRFPERTGLETAAFNKSATDQQSVKYTCFYCNTPFLREVHLFEHMKQHTKHFPYVCPYCAQGYVKRLCLVKHIERFHSKDIIQASAKSGRDKTAQDSFHGSIRSTHTRDATPVQPVGHMTAPVQGKPTVRVEKEPQLGKLLEANSSNTSNGNVEHCTSLNGYMQHSRALTVSLPDEVNIPAGCLVELVEVKTVNGTKELKLRVVSQQENKSVVKEKRTTAGQNTALGKPTPSTLKHPIKVTTPTTMGASTVIRRRYEVNKTNLEQPAVIPVAVSNNFVNPGRVNKRGLKRQCQEIINLEPNTPRKIPKVVVNAGKDAPIIVGSPLKHKAPPPTVSCPRAAPTRTGVCQKVGGESRIEVRENIKNVPLQRKCDSKTIRAAMTFEPGGSHLSSKAITNSVREALALSLNSRPSGSAVANRPQAASSNKDNDANPVFSLPKPVSKPMSIQTPPDLNHASLKMLLQSRESLAKKPPAQSFPVISSVFSLSQQPENLQGPIKPVLMALRGAVMDKMSKTVSSHRDVEPSSAEETREDPKSKNDTFVETENGSFRRESLKTERTNEPIKEEQDKDFQLRLVPDTVHVKEEKYNPALKDDDPDLKNSTEAELVSPTLLHNEVFASTQTSQQQLKNELDISKFLTVSLERMQVDEMEKHPSSPKLGSPKEKRVKKECTVMPLNMNQPVKRPSANQPVVVLNHPKPRISAQKATADSCSEAETHRELPECQILKMRLSKVMGQRYEVMGYTVKVAQ